MAILAEGGKWGHDPATKVLENFQGNVAA